MTDWITHIASLSIMILYIELRLHWFDKHIIRMRQQFLEYLEKLDKENRRLRKK